MTAPTVWLSVDPATPPAGAVAYRDRAEGTPVFLLHDSTPPGGACGGEVRWQSGHSPGSPAVVFVVRFPVPQDQLAEFDEWFTGEHGPMLLRADQWWRSRLVACADGALTRMAVHELGHADVLDSPERAEAGATPATARLLSRPWFADVDRFVLEPA